MKILVGIPAFNEESVIAKVVKTIPSEMRGLGRVDVLVVDDGSTDNTPGILKKNNILFLSHLLNRGLGGALKTIFAYARKYGYDYLITFDADGQHSSQDIERLIRNLKDKKLDFCIGSRWLSGRNAPLLRKLANTFANIFTFILYGIVTSDSQSGLRAFNAKGIKLINLATDGMEVSSEFFQQAKMNNLKYGEISIQPVYTSYSMKKGQRLSNAPSVALELLLRLLR